MERIPRQFYTDEFRHEAVSLVADGGLTSTNTKLFHDLPPWFWHCVGVSNKKTNITHVCKGQVSFCPQLSAIMSDK